MTRIFFALMVLTIFGCSNTVEENVGGLPNIAISGTVLNGNLRYAKVQLVGIDQYGQPQQVNNQYLGDIKHTDENGQYQSAIQGAYKGPLLAVVAYDEYKVLVSAATSTQTAVYETRKTQIRCALNNGCRDELGNSVAFGDWYVASSDFELWAAVNNAQNLSQLHITPITHLAAKLAFSDFQWDGVGTCDASSCDGSIAIEGMLTPQSIHEANTRVMALFNAQANLHAVIAPFSPFLNSDLDGVEGIESAKHGLLGMTWQYQARERSLSMSAVLDSWLNDAFLNNTGQLYTRDDTNTPAQWDLTTAFEDAIAVKDEITSGDDALSSAVTAFQTILNNLTPNVVTNEKGASYSDDVADQVLEAKTFVAKVQGWLLDYETKDFSRFLDADTATELAAMEVQWESFQKTLGPELQSVFSPMVQLVDYALLCSANASCVSGQAYGFLDANASVSFDGANSFTYTSSNEPNTIIKGQLSNTVDSGLIKTFTFSQDINIESDYGLAIVQSRAANRATITLDLETQLQAGVAPAISHIKFSLPKLTLKAKTALASSSYQDLIYSADDVVLTMQGVKDVTRTAEPIHFNLESLVLLGQIASGSDVLDVDITFNGSNANLHYPPERFPDLNFVWKSADIKRYGQFDHSALDRAQWAGWLSLPSNAMFNETLSGPDEVVTYNEIDQYSGLPQALQDDLALTEFDSFEFAELRFPGGSTGLVIFTKEGNGQQWVHQCNEKLGQWSCSLAIKSSELGCQSRYGDDANFSDTITAAQAFLFLKNNVDENNIGCIPQVTIDGRGIYNINYAGLTQFDDGDTFTITLDEPYYLGLSSFNIRLLSRFTGAEGEGDETPVLLNILGAFTDPENVSLAFSITHDFIGYGNTSSSLGLLEVIPYGERTLWVAVGNGSQFDSNSLVYYFLDNQVQIIMSAFDYASGNDFHDAPLGYVRYAGTLVGTLRQEGDLYVIRYIDGSWQLL